MHAHERKQFKKIKGVIIVCGILINKFDMDKETQPRWIDGIYKIGTLSNRIFKVTGQNVEMQKITDGGNGSVQAVIWKHGSFGECHPDVAKITGKKTNNIQILMWGGKWRS